MSRRVHVFIQVQKTPDDLTLPADCLSEAKRIADARNLTLCAVVAEALSEGLRLQTTAERREAVLAAYKKAFHGFSDEELSILDGVILDSPLRH